MSKFGIWTHNQEEPFRMVGRASIPCTGSPCPHCSGPGFVSDLQPFAACHPPILSSLSCPNNKALKDQNNN